MVKYKSPGATSERIAACNYGIPICRARHPVIGIVMWRAPHTIHGLWYGPLLASANV